MNYVISEIRDLSILFGNKLEKHRNSDVKMNVTKLKVIDYLIKHKDEKVCQKDLEKYTKLKKASITGCLDSLQDDEIINRVQSSVDKRINYIVFTTKATKTHEKMFEQINNLEKQITSGISNEDLKIFFKVTDQIKKNIKDDK